MLKTSTFFAEAGASAASGGLLKRLTTINVERILIRMSGIVRNRPCKTQSRGMNGRIGSRNSAHRSGKSSGSGGGRAADELDRAVDHAGANVREHDPRRDQSAFRSAC